MDSPSRFPMAVVRTIARAFIEEHYRNELTSFDVIWDVFFRMVERREGRAPNVSRLLGDVGAALGFTGSASVDAVGLVVLGTVAKVMERTWGKGGSPFSLERIVSKAATESAAEGDLLAVLIRHLPAFVEAARSVKTGVRRSVISVAAEPQYEVWTEGKHDIVRDIRQYEARKGDYLFWIDLDEKPLVSTRNPGVRLGREAADLLVYLVKRLGNRVAFKQVLKEMWREEPHTTAELRRSQENKVEQQITALDKFCGGGFREFLFGEKFAKGLGLRESFLDKYFIFCRLR